MAAPALSAPDTTLNVGAHLSRAAAESPSALAVSAAAGRGWLRLTFAELDERSTALAHGLRDAGIGPGERTLVMVRAGVDLITLTWALFKAGAIPILIDPGMGRAAFLACVGRSEPTSFIGIPLAHLARLVFPGAFRGVRRSVVVGPRALGRGPSLEDLLSAGRRTRGSALPETRAGDVAAVLFTSGSTGPAKGAVYTHGNFDAQVRLLREAYAFRPGEVDLAAFPLFSLFDAAFGMTSVVPDLDPSRPGTCDPAKVVAAVRAHGCTSAFGSPAVWRRVAPYCAARGIRLDTLRRVLIAGAPVPAALVAQMHAVLPPEGDVHTPYGATEALPVATISGREVVGETAALTREGAGTCVGRPVNGTEVRIVAITDDEIPSWAAATPAPIGEICARGPVVTRAYDRLPEATRLAKIADGGEVWHRMGDLGYFDERGRLWFCGRKAERVTSAAGTLYTDRLEGRALADARVARCALVGVGPLGAQRPVLVVEGREDAALAADLAARTGVDTVLFHPALPVDARHNAKIHRLTLKRWAEGRLGLS